ncbi:MAG: c-type cytochrome [Candidatus Tectomicrobia bacterium]|nr:c-type cytochrome [Candidatus Tectomicrobia bacterium]
MALLLAVESPVLGSEAPPAWAYPVNPPGLKPAPDAGTPRHVPGSDAAFTLTQIRDLHFAPDWHPEDHPPMPDIVARGRKPDVLACGSCHRADGSGGPENAKLAGLPAVYIAQQMADFKSGARTTSVPERAPPQLMIATAKAINEQEIEAAAAYFSALQPRSAIRVVEAESVPKTRVTGWHLAVAADHETEPLGRRIVEVPENLEYFALRDGRARFVAYVPPGSVQRGQALVASGNGKTVACGICHGPDLKGLGPIPGIAGRSPSYVVRQLYDFKTGARAGLWSALMKPVVEKLSVDDMIALAAYAASLSP